MLKITLFFVLLSLFSAPSFSQFSQETIPARIRLDSLQRALTVKVLTPTDQKNLRICRQEKQEFLKVARLNEKDLASLDQALLEAKLKDVNPNDTAIQELLQRKYTLEQKIENAYIASARGKVCLTQEKQREKKIAAAVKQSLEYQALKQKTESESIRQAQ